MSATNISDAVVETMNWHTLTAEFTKALREVTRYCGADDPRIETPRIYFHPDWIEYADSGVAFRYRAKFGIDSAFLVDGKLVATAMKVQPTAFAINESGIHFKIARGAMLSCPRIQEEYSDGDPYEARGVKIAFSRKAALAARDVGQLTRAEGDEISLNVWDGELTILADDGENFYLWESLPIEYSGHPMIFTAPPRHFARISTKHLTEWTLCRDRMVYCRGPVSIALAIEDVT